MELGGLQRTPADPTPGNVIDPTVEGESLHGPWDTVLGGVLDGDLRTSPFPGIRRLRWRRT